MPHSECHIRKRPFVFQALAVTSRTYLKLLKRVFIPLEIVNKTYCAVSPDSYFGGLQQFPRLLAAVRRGKYLATLQHAPDTNRYTNDEHNIYQVLTSCIFIAKENYSNL